MKIRIVSFVFLCCNLITVSAVWFPTYGKKGVPDNRVLTIKISRSTGTGPLTAGYAIIAFLAFAFVVAVMAAILCYKREKGIRSDERTLFYA